MNRLVRLELDAARLYLKMARVSRHDEQLHQRNIRAARDAVAAARAVSRWIA